MTAIDHVEKQQARYLCARAGIEPVLTAVPAPFQSQIDATEPRGLLRW